VVGLLGGLVILTSLQVMGGEDRDPAEQVLQPDSVQSPNQLPVLSPEALLETESGFRYPVANDIGAPRPAGHQGIRMEPATAHERRAAEKAELDPSSELPPELVSE
jgi:hypothetical protein